MGTIEGGIGEGKRGGQGIVRDHLKGKGHLVNPRGTKRARLKEQQGGEGKTTGGHTCERIEHAESKERIYLNLIAVEGARKNREKF